MLLVIITWLVNSLVAYCLQAFCVRSRGILLSVFVDVRADDVLLARQPALTVSAIVSVSISLVSGAADYVAYVIALLAVRTPSSLLVHVTHARIPVPSSLVEPMAPPRTPSAPPRCGFSPGDLDVVSMYPTHAVHSHTDTDYVVSSQTWFGGAMVSFSHVVPDLLMHVSSLVLRSSCVIASFCPVRLFHQLPHLFALLTMVFPFLRSYSTLGTFSFLPCWHGSHHAFVN